MIPLRSRLRRLLFAYFYTNPEAEHYLREIAAMLRLDPANLSREMERLEAEGLFLSRVRGRQKYFRLNRLHPLFREYRRIVFKTVGVEGQLRSVLSQIKGIEQAFLFGSFAVNQQDAKSDVDVLIVGSPEATQLASRIRHLEKMLGREVNYTVVSRQEFKSRLRRKDAFLRSALRRKIDLLVA